MQIDHSVDVLACCVYGQLPQVHLLCYLYNLLNQIASNLNALILNRSYLFCVPELFSTHLCLLPGSDLFDQCFMLFLEQPLMHVHRGHIHLKTLRFFLQRRDPCRLYIIYLITEINFYLGNKDTAGSAAGLS
jgi:hypothetical protein